MTRSEPSAPSRTVAAADPRPQPRLTETNAAPIERGGRREGRVGRNATAIAPAGRPKSAPTAVPVLPQSASFALHVALLSALMVLANAPALPPPPPDPAVQLVFAAPATRPPAIPTPSSPQPEPPASPPLEPPPPEPAPPTPSPPPEMPTPGVATPPPLAPPKPVKSAPRPPQPRPVSRPAAPQPAAARPSPPADPATAAPVAPPVAAPPAIVPVPGEMAGNCPGSYPPAALRRGIHGRVVLRVRIAPNGTPIDVHVATSSGSDLLDRAAADAVRNCTHFPVATQAGQPVAYSADAGYTFKIEN